MVRWHGKNQKFYKNKGYNFTKFGELFEVKVEDLQQGSNVYVEVKCDNQNCEQPNLKPIQFCSYIKRVHLNGNYYCKKCAINLYANKNLRITQLKKSKSFDQWCIENNRQDILDRWDYELNDCKPNEICYSSNKKYWFKCPRKLHNSELKYTNAFMNGQEGSIRCKACNSFAQWGIDNLGDDFLEKYWDYNRNKNIDPWHINYRSSINKFWIKCQEKDYHESYKTFCANFVAGVRCPYCCNKNGKIHPLDSLGKLLEDKGLLNIWSDKNQKSPYEYAPVSGKEVWWKCPEGKHDDFLRIISNSNIYGFRCHYCDFSKGEKRIESYLYIKNINFIPQKSFDGLIGLGGGLLSYDFYLPDYNLLIEYQGEFHDGNGNYFVKQNLEYRYEHDRRKREYVKINDINLLEIWYEDFDNIEDILCKILCSK